MKKKYELADQNLQLRLDALCAPGETTFTDALQGAKRLYGTGWYLVGFGGIVGDAEAFRFRVALRGAEIKEVPEYSPTAWNTWPEIEPPANTMMCVEYAEGDRKIRTGLWYDAHGWHTPTGTDIDVPQMRFRPWPKDDES